MVTARLHAPVPLRHTTETGTSGFRHPLEKRSRSSTSSTLNSAVTILTTYLFSYSPPLTLPSTPRRNRLFMHPVVNAHLPRPAILISRFRAHYARMMGS